MSPDPMRANSASVTLYTEPNGPRALLRPAIGASALVLIRSYRASRAPETSEAAVLVWFWLRHWQRPCLVPVRGGGAGDSRAGVPELHAGVAAAAHPGRGRMGARLCAAASATALSAQRVVSARIEP